jgi:hypothetical protein
VKKKNSKDCANSLRITALFTQKKCQKALKNMDLGSEIRDSDETYFGSRIPGSKRHRIPDLQRRGIIAGDPYHCLFTGGHHAPGRFVSWVANSKRLLLDPKFFHLQIFLILDLDGDGSSQKTNNRQKLLSAPFFLVELKIKSSFEAESGFCLK